MDILGSTPGAVVALETDPGIPMSLQLEEWGGYDEFKSIITTFRIQSQGGVQFVHTMRDFIYIYSLGERIGEMMIGGISFSAQCETLDAYIHGLEYAYGYYLNHRATSTPFPGEILLGSVSAFYGFLLGFQGALDDTERIVGNFTMNFKMIPQPSLLDYFFT